MLESSTSQATTIRRLILPALFLSLLVGGTCSAHARPKSAAKLAAESAAESALPSLHIEGALTTKGSSTINLSGAPFTVLIDSSNRMLVTMGGPFGMTLAQLLLTQDHFVLVNYLAQEVWDGNPDADEIRAQMHLPVRPSELLALFRGRIPGNLARFSEPTRRADSTLLYRAGGNQPDDLPYDNVEFALVDGPTGMLKQYQVKASDGTLVLDVSVGEYREIAGTPIPHRITMTSKNRQESATITITEAGPWDDEQDTVDLTIPPSYRRRTFQ